MKKYLAVGLLLLIGCDPKPEPSGNPSSLANNPTPSPVATTPDSSADRPTPPSVKASKIDFFAVGQASYATQNTTDLPGYRLGAWHGMLNPFVCGISDGSLDCVRLRDLKGTWSVREKDLKVPVPDFSDPVIKVFIDDEICASTVDEFKCLAMLKI